MIGGRDMLLKFRVKNYRSIKQEAVLDLEAVGLNDQRECLLKHKKKVISSSDFDIWKEWWRKE